MNPIKIGGGILLSCYAIFAGGTLFVTQEHITTPDPLSSRQAIVEQGIPEGNLLIQAIGAFAALAAGTGLIYSGLSEEYEGDSRCPLKNYCPF